MSGAVEGVESATPGPYIVADGTLVGSIAPVPHDLEISEWYDQTQNDGPDYRFVAETATGTDEGRANAKLIADALNTITTPPARSYADAIEDAAKAIEEWEDWGQWYGMDRNNAVAQEVCKDAAAAIRLLSQEPKP